VNRLAVRKQIEVPFARIQIAQFNTPVPAENTFRADDVFWIDI
jgi:hypothetical protein